MNRDELGALTSLPVNSHPECQEAAAQLCQGERFGLIVTSADAGVMACVEGKVLSQDTVHVENTADTVGAGDAFAAVPKVSTPKASLKESNTMTSSETLTFQKRRHPLGLTATESECNG